MIYWTRYHHVTGGSGGTAIEGDGNIYLWFGVDPANHDGVERVEQFFDHEGVAEKTPCSEAFENWRVTFTDGERVDVAEPLSASTDTVISSARDAKL